MTPDDRAKLMGAIERIGRGPMGRNPDVLLLVEFAKAQLAGAQIQLIVGASLELTKMREQNKLRVQRHRAKKAKKAV